MKSLLIILVLITFVTVNAERKFKSEPDFMKWKNKYKKDKWTEKESTSLEKRAERVLQKKQKCAEHNAKKGVEWECGSNEFDHLTSAEVKGRLLGLMPPMEARALPRPPIFNSYSPGQLSCGPMPEAADWSNWCPPIYSQGSCGSCWAFAALSTLECYNRMKQYPVTQLSPQFLIDCDSSNNKCTGGWPTTAFNSLINKYGTSCPSNSDYPYTSYAYTSTNTGYNTCNTNTRRYALNYTSTYQIYVNGKEETLKQLIVNYGPVAMGFYASSAFMSYRSGVFSDPLCPKSTATVPQCDYQNLNHGKLKNLKKNNLNNFYFLKPWS
jgi:hypothetical protein